MKRSRMFIEINTQIHLGGIDITHFPSQPLQRFYIDLNKSCAERNEKSISLTIMQLHSRNSDKT
jgi:hypothetical protein